MNLVKFTASACLLAGVFFSIPSFAQTEGIDSTTDISDEPTQAEAQLKEAALAQPQIEEVNFTGLDNIDSNVLYTAIKSQSRTFLDPARISADLKALFEFGFFKNAQALVKRLPNGNVNLTFKMLEKPQIRDIVIRGNYKFSDNEITEKLSIYKFNMLDEQKIKFNIAAIKEYYKSKGLFSTQVTIEVKQLDENWVELSFVIDEDPRSYLMDINITGPEFFYPIDIQRSMNSSEIDGVSSINSSGIFHEQLINADVYQIYQKYLREGFIKVKIDRPEITQIKNEDYSRFQVDINITDGDRYFVGKVDIESADDNELIVPKDQLMALVTLIPNDPDNPFRQYTDRASIDSVYQNRGYAYAQIAVDTKIHEDTKRVDVTYKIFRGEIAYINRVDFSGNYSTMDYVLRRELAFYDNEIFDGTKVRESEANLIRLGLFVEGGAGVRASRKDREGRNELDYIFQFEEGQTGTLNGNLQYSEQKGFGLGLSLSERNFLGRGYAVKLSIDYVEGGDYKAAASITEKYIFDTKFTSTTSVSYSVDPTDSDYDETTLSLSQLLSYPFWRSWSWINRLAASTVKYTDVSEEGLISLEGDTQHDVFSYRTGTVYSTVNHPTFPSSGQEMGIFAEQIGGDILKGDDEYARADFNYRYFFPLNEDSTIIFMGKFETSYLFQTNSDELIPTSRRLYLGGVTTIRGFDFDEIAGPSSIAERSDSFSLTVLRDSSSDPGSDYKYYLKHRGGIVSRLFNFELLFPLTREGQNIRGVVFFDAGNVWSEGRMYAITGAKNDNLYYRFGYGIGVRFITPMGVIRFEYGNKLNPKPSESPGQMHFFISGLF